MLSDAAGHTSDWHDFGMEWKEHIAWVSPMLATLAAFLVFVALGVLGTFPTFFQAFAPK